MVDGALANLTGRAREFLRWFYGREQVRSIPIQNRLMKQWWISPHAARENLVALDQRGLVRVSGGYIHPVEGVGENVLGESASRSGGGGPGACPECGCTCRSKKGKSSVVQKAFVSPFRPEGRD